MCQKQCVCNGGRKTVGTCTVASVFRHTLCLPNTEKTTELKLIVLQIVLARKPQKRRKRSMCSYFTSNPSFLINPHLTLPTMLLLSTYSLPLFVLLLSSQCSERNTLLYQSQTSGDRDSLICCGRLACHQPWLQR